VGLNGSDGWQNAIDRQLRKATFGPDCLKVGLNCIGMRWVLDLYDGFSFRLVIAPLIAKKWPVSRRFLLMKEVDKRAIGTNWWGLVPNREVFSLFLSGIFLGCPGQPVLARGFVE